MQVKILPFNGAPAPIYYHEGKKFVEGREGTEYTIELYNDSYSRVLAIPSVDGLSILDGKPASYNSSGYVLKPHETIKIPGWTLDNKNVAKFIFSAIKQSYVSKTNNDESNVGVIGVVVFNEKIFYFDNDFLNYIQAFPTGSGNISGFVDNTVTRRITASVNDSFTLAAQNSQVGTGFGNKKSFETTEVDFNKQDLPTEIHAIYYDSRRNLEKMGVQISPKPEYKNRNPFPGGGCIPPAGWRG